MECEEQLVVALKTLTGDQLYVLAGVIHGLTEGEIAVELTTSRNQVITRDRVHRIKLTAIAKMRRALDMAASA